ncbi:MAG: hypothetical protein ACFB20_02490 [Opitutales bacterium]
MSWAGRMGAVWGFCGVFALIGSACWRLGQIGVEALNGTYAIVWYHWAFLVPWVLFMGMSEGYRGFQQAFSPRVVARAKYLASHPSVARVLLAPLFCMGFFHATKKRRIVAFCLTGGILVLVLLVRLLPQPWRGLVDVGVVVGLGWGLAAMLVFAVQALTGPFDVSPETPDDPLPRPKAAEG